MTELNESAGTQDNKSSEQTEHFDTTLINYPMDAEKVNGRWAMLGLVALIGAYSSTGQIIPGIFQGYIYRYFQDRTNYGFILICRLKFEITNRIFDKKTWNY